jgi:uncharacterized membrane protein YbhN (UPF0104 family)
MTDETPHTPPEKQPLWKRALPIVIGLAIVVFLFGYVLPQFIDYEAVFRSIGEISWWEWGILLVLAGIRFVPEGWIYIAAQPGLTTSQGTQLFLVAETLSNVPPGGLDLISRFQMTKSWGFSNASSTSATIASWVFTSLSKIVLPIFAVALLAIDEIQDDGLDGLALLGLGVVAGLFRKNIETDFRQLVHDFRGQASEVLTTRTHIGFIAGLAARIASFLVLIFAVRFVGIGADEVSWTVIFAAFSVIMAITVIPIFNLPGITEVILIGTLTRYAGTEFSDQIAAAVFVYRILTWLLPIPFGGFAFNRWRDSIAESGDTDLLDAFDADDTGSPPAAEPA